MSHANTNELIEVSNQIEEAARSAVAVVPQILALFPWVRSVVDVGCGVGEWLHQFSLHGVSQLLGVDAQVPPEYILQIKPSEFQQKDLSAPFTLPQHFDLALCLQLGEHLTPQSTTELIKSLTQASDLIVFGAGIPGQANESTANERWPSYWAALFEKQGFLCFDVLRGEVWYDQRVEWWYRQNMLVYVNKQRPDLIKKLEEIEVSANKPLDLVHPLCLDIYRRSSELLQQGRYAEASMSSVERTEIAVLRDRVYEIENSISWRLICKINKFLDSNPSLLRLIRRCMGLAGKLLNTNISPVRSR